MASFEPIYGRSYFFDGGLHFECTQCGGCCTGAPGLVRVSTEELKAITALLDTNQADLIKAGIVERFEEAYRLYESPDDGSCVFFKDNRCQIYAARPLQCRTWPFWLENIRSEQKWREAARHCLGIGRGRLFSKEEILALLNL